MYENLRKLVELTDDVQQAETVWLRHVLTLAAGALAILAGLGLEVPPDDDGLARYFLAATWACLGLGIASGAAATYVETSRARDAARRFLEELARSIEDETPMPAEIVAHSNWLLRGCKPLMIFSLLTAVVCLVAYSAITTLHA